VQELPNDVLLFLLASRYCEVDSELRDTAWSLFGTLPAGWPLVQAVCTFTHRHIRFDYMQGPGPIARPSTFFASAPESAAITCTWPSHSAGP
jgi:hypothetical protein